MKFNASMIGVWMKCPLQAKFNETTDKPRVQNAAASFGTCVHDALDLYNKTGDMDQAVQRFLETWSDPSILGVEPDVWPRRMTYGGLRETGVQMLTDYHETSSWSKREVVGSEVKFCVPFGDHLLSGIVDVLEATPRALKIVDYKAQPLDAKVMTPGGWRRMGDLQVGDFVSSADGSFSKIEGVYPQGYVPAYRVHFSDGSSTVCSDEHLWTIKDMYPASKLPVRTERLKDLGPLRRGRNYRYFVPLCGPIEHDEVDYLIDPYLMGLLLAEGGFTSSGLKVSATEPFIIDEISRLLPEGMEAIFVDGANSFSLVDRTQRGNRFIAELRRLGLWGKSSLDKSIPEEYLLGSVSQRKDLLAGLVDGDGSSSNRNQYRTSSPQLKDGFLELVRSLGGSPIAREHGSWYRKPSGERVVCAPSWHVSIRTPFNPFRLPRKAEGWRAPKNTLARAISEIEPLGINLEMQCIKVSADDELYVTDDYIVTHNTNSSQPMLDSLYLNVQFTIYYYASLQPEFWMGFDDGIKKYPGMENGEELYERFKNKDRTPIWYHLRKNKAINCGKRDDLDFMRLYRCCEEIAKAIEKDVYVPSISGDSCVWCDHTDICRAYIPPHQEPGALKEKA